MKTISKLKKDKEQIAKDFEQEEECLTNDLSRKLLQVQFFPIFNDKLHKIKQPKCLLL